MFITIGNQHPGKSLSSRRLLLAAWLLLALVPTACLDVQDRPGSSSNEPSGGRPSVSKLAAVFSDPERPLSVRMQAAKEAVDFNICFELEDASQCNWREFSLDPGSLAPEKLSREAVLIIGRLPPAVQLLRYQGRIAGYYGFTNRGEIEPRRPTWRLPSLFGEILEAFASPAGISAAELAPLGEALERRYGKHVDNAVAHGTPVFSALIDRVGRAPIVLVDVWHGPLGFASDGSRICDLGRNDPDGSELEPIRRAAERAADALRRLMGEHNVHFVNASFGASVDTLERYWKTRCEGTVPPRQSFRAALVAHEPLYDAMFNTSAVFAAQAAIESPVDEDFPFDQLSERYLNRLRIGSFTYLGYDIPVAGITDPEPDWRTNPPSDDADVYINCACSGMEVCREKGGPMIVHFEHGMGEGLMPYCETPWLTPFALASFIGHRNTAPFANREMSDELIQELIDTFIPVCTDETGDRRRFQDPLLHNDFGAHTTPR